jgi:uncharacterized protein YjiS (DUF1127 family)
MSAQFAKDRVSFVAPMNISATAPSGFGPANASLIGGAVRAVAKWFADRLERRAVMSELAMLSDHELADIGLTRGDVPYVFDRPAQLGCATTNAARA